jgi:hypothetical protein
MGLIGIISDTVVEINDATENASTVYSSEKVVSLLSAMFSGLSKITVSTVEPTTPSTNDLWVDTN